MMRREGPPPARGVRHRLRPGAYAILVGRDGRLLMVETDEVQLPGGGIDPGEGQIAALVREVREETGHACLPRRRLGAWRAFVWMPEYAMHAEKICHVYEALAGPRLGPPSEPNHRAVWMTPAVAVARLGPPGAARYVAAWAARAPGPSKVR